MQFEALKRDVFKKLKEGLPSNLHYHGFHHTLYVYDAALKIAEYERVTGKELTLLLTGVILHDAGFLVTYHQHEEAGCRIAEEMLPAYQYAPQDIELVKAMIMRTKIPQSARNRMEEILCDADLDYLGTEDFFTIGNQLYREFMENGIVHDEQEWNRLQIKFLSGHEYFTAYSKTNRSAKKWKNFDLVQKIVDGYVSGEQR